MMTAFEIARVMASPQGARLYNTLRRLVESEGLSVDQVMQQSVEHMERMESLAKRSGITVKQIADDSLALYETHLKGQGRLK